VYKILAPKTTKQAFGFEILDKKFCIKNARKMLMKLTVDWQTLTKATLYFFTDLYQW